MTRTKLRVALVACCLCACAEQHARSGDDNTTAEPDPGAASAERPERKPDAGSGSGETPASSTGGVTQRNASAPALVDAASLPPAEDRIDLCPSRTFSPSRLEALVAGAGTCSFVTDWPPIKDPKFVNLYVGDRVRPILLVHDMVPVSDGWRLESDMRTITLLGAACVDAQAGARIMIELACDWSILR